jgi:putative transposase
VSPDKAESTLLDADPRWAEGFRRLQAIQQKAQPQRGRLTAADMAALSAELRVSQATLYRLIARYRRSATVEALLPGSSGRPVGFRLLDDKVEAIIARCIREVYLTQNRPTLARLVAEVHARCMAAELPLPDRRTVRARVRAIPERMRALRRRDAAALKAVTATPGELVARRPLELVQIDHTQVDVIVVDEERRQALPGRPWLTLAIDVCSRMVTGLHLSMDAPSRTSLGLCMLHATFDKRAWLNEHGVEAEWPVAGLPERILVDNGADFRSAAFRRACENQGIGVEYRPPGKAHYGGHIERLMGTMMNEVQALPGTTFGSIAKRGRQDPAKTAGLTLHELESYFAITIAEGYHHRIHRSLQRPPIAVWRETVDATPLRLPQDRLGFWVSFLPEARRRLRPDGVHMFNERLRYWHGALAADLRHSGRDVLVKYDPRDISRIFVERPTGAFVEARWTDLTWPPVSLHEWRNREGELRRKGRAEQDLGMVLNGTARKRNLIDRAKRLTYDAQSGRLPSTGSAASDENSHRLRGIDTSTPVPGEE